LPVQLPAVTAHVVSLLRGVPQSGISTSAVAQGLSVQAYTALLPTIWALISTRTPSRHARKHGVHNDDDELTGDDVLVAVLEHALRTSSSSATKPVTLQFVGRLVLVRSLSYALKHLYKSLPTQLNTDPQYRGTLRLGDTRNSSLATGSPDRLTHEWILHLPKTLWELGGTQPGASAMILRLLLRLSQRRPDAVYIQVSMAFLVISAG
jgi:pre-rRNA-processing protein IPI1